MGATQKTALSRGASWYPQPPSSARFQIPARTLLKRTACLVGEHPEATAPILLLSGYQNYQVHTSLLPNL